jgi:hypothetical protein
MRSRQRLRRVWLLLPLFALGCTGTSPGEKAVKQPPTKPFSAKSFFLGRTEGKGTLRQIMSPTRAVQVNGQGLVERDGTLVLEQTVIDGKTPPRMRRWRLHEDLQGGYSGTMSDAIGPVKGEMSGDRLTLRFKMKDGGLDAAQGLWMEADGIAAHNLIVVRKFGIKVAVIDQTIHKMD